MRLLVPMRINLALRMATSHPVSRGTAASATQRPASKQRSKPAAAAAQPKTPAVLQQLWELTKLSSEKPDPLTRWTLQAVREHGVLDQNAEAALANTIKTLSDRNDFASIEKLLEAQARTVLDKDKALKEEAPKRMDDRIKTLNMFRSVNNALWAASLAKSLGSQSPAILNWIEKAVSRLDEPIQTQKELMLWLLSNVRGDLPMLQQLQQEAIDKGRVGPEIEREKTLSHVALTYLEAGKEDEFRSLWNSSGINLLEGYDDQFQHSSAMLHHALLRKTKKGKPDAAMLRWYAESLAANQRTPIAEKPQFETMMVPMMRNLGGRIEKWKSNDRRLKKLRKWRDDYDDAKLDGLRDAMLDYVTHLTVEQNYGTVDDLRALERMLARLDNSDEKEGDKRRTVVVDWLNLLARSEDDNSDVSRLYPSCSLVVVGRKRKNKGDWTPCSPEENERIKVMEVSRKKEKTQEVDDLCALILAVATRGHLLTNDKTRPHVVRFHDFCKQKSKDLSHSLLLKNYLNDAVLRHQFGMLQPVVDHSKAAQWIDREKKELVFTVAHKPAGLNSDHLYSVIDYYSLHLD